MKSLLLELIPIIPLLTYAGIVVVVLMWMRWRRNTKWPFKKSDRLLRMPGESLKKEMGSLEDRYMGEFFGGCIAALVAIPASFQLLRWIGQSNVAAMVSAVAVFVVVLGTSAWRIGKLGMRRGDYYMGWFGERIVADRLRPLQAQGYRVFHDVPCEGATGKFNIDHVTIGPTGLAVIETKTKRKRTASGADAESEPEHQVVFDGIKLNWPNGTASDRPMKQVHNNAKWLIEWIEEQTGLKVAAKRIVTIPGWMVRETPKTLDRALRVIPPHFLRDAIIGHGEVVLDQTQIDLISRQLETKCRDVED